jgi:hypothetical protein
MITADAFVEATKSGPQKPSTIRAILHLDTCRNNSYEGILLKPTSSGSRLQSHVYEKRTCENPYDGGGQMARRLEVAMLARLLRSRSGGLLHRRTGRQARQLV